MDSIIVAPLFSDFWLVLANGGTEADQRTRGQAKRSGTNPQSHHFLWSPAAVNGGIVLSELLRGGPKASPMLPYHHHPLHESSDQG